MKTSEFKRIIKNCELYTGDLDAASRISLGDSDFGNYDVAYISPNDQWIFSIQPCFCHIKPKYIHTVWQAIFDYAATPIAEREDEPKFCVAVSPSYYKDEGVWYLSSRKAGYANESGKSIEWGASEGANAHEFTPKSYVKFLKEFPEWRPFLHDYDPDNTDVFVPVEDNE
jgi:hypothetical protein